MNDQQATPSTDQTAQHLDLLPHRIVWARCACEQPNCDKGELRILNEKGEMVVLVRLSRKELDWQIQQAKDLALILALAARKHEPEARKDLPRPPGESAR